MPIKCPICQNTNELSFSTQGYANRMELNGLISCEGQDSKKHPKYSWPVRVESTSQHGIMLETATSLPVSESKKLSAKVPAGLCQDIIEAETSHYHSSYKAAVVLCRRSVQLALEDRLGLSSKRFTLGPLLDEERKAPLFTDGEYHLAVMIKDIGDGGAHRAMTGVDASTVATVILHSVQLLNKLYPA